MFEPNEYYMAESAAEQKARECGIPHAVVELFDNNEWSKSLGFDVVSEDTADDYAEDNNGEVQYRTGPYQGAPRLSHQCIIHDHAECAGCDCTCHDDPESL